MARRRRSSSSFAQRDVITSSLTARLSALVEYWRRRPIVSLLDISDRRRYDPLGGFRGPGVFSRRDQGYVRARPVDRASRLIVADKFGFAVPHKVAICVRRKQRREVLFAKQLTRSGRGGAKRRNYYSEVHC